MSSFVRCWSCAGSRKRISSATETILRQSFLYFHVYVYMVFFRLPCSPLLVVLLLTSCYAFHLSHSAPLYWIIFCFRSPYFLFSLFPCFPPSPYCPFIFSAFFVSPSPHPFCQCAVKHSSNAWKSSWYRAYLGMWNPLNLFFLVFFDFSLCL